MNVVIVANDLTLEKIKKHYYNDLDLTIKVPHAKYVFLANDCKITVYNSNKIMFQGKEASAHAALWDSNVKTKDNSIVNLSFDEAIGSDEVGTGDYFGPVVVCCAYLNNELKQKISTLMIADSKKLSDQQICAVAPKLIEVIPHEVYLLDNAKYNVAQKKNNLNAIKAKMHNYVLVRLTKTIKHKVPVIVDKFCEEKNYFGYLDYSKEIYEDITFETKAEDKFLCVAIASIIARYHFLCAFDTLSYKYGVILLKGASAKVDQQASELVKQFGFDVLEQVAKVHFANTNKVKAILNK